MLRRNFVRNGIGLLAACVWTFNGVQAHTPFKQWVVYRRKHLLIGCHKQDMETYALAKQMIRVLETRLPAAKARVARAPNPGRLASLLGTDQLDVALLSYEDAIMMAAGKGSFKPYGEIELKVLFLHSKYVLVGRADIPAKHAWLIAHAFDKSEIENNILDDEVPPLSWHNGTKLYLSGRPIPDV